MKKSKIIIFTGHDMAGKTTIAKKLSDKIKIPYFKSNKQHNKNHNHLLGLQYSIEEFTQFFEQVTTKVILDRFVESEFVYSKIHNRETDEQKIFEIDERLSKLDTFYIYCYKNEDKYIDDDLLMITKDKYDDLKKHFDLFFKKTNCKYLYLNTSDENLENQIKNIINFINV